jgi:hypothetical protein
MEGFRFPEVLGEDAADYHHPVSIMYILGVRAVKGADADEVLFVG